MKADVFGGRRRRTYRRVISERSARAAAVEGTPREAVDRGSNRDAQG